MKSMTMLLGVCSIVLAAPAARAQESIPEAESIAPTGRVNRLREMWRFELGYRGAFVPDPGYDPFSTQSYFSQLSMTASRTIFHRGTFSFAPGVSYDYGKSSATARGDATSLEVHRLVVPLEGRLHFGTWGYAFLRAAPGAALENIEVDDATVPAPLTKSRWLFATDVSAGYAFPLWPRANPFELTPRIWLQTDWGYGWIFTQRLNPAPALASGDARLASGVDLGSITMRGAFFRVAGSVSF